MGTSFDCFDQRAHTTYTGISPRAQLHRRWLRDAMLRRGFAPYAKEWWHFTLAPEPFPHRYFDFEIR
jgi:D-alanyl-D-alanine dipeptidase